jgi:hypothetical protein
MNPRHTKRISGGIPAGIKERYFFEGRGILKWLAQSESTQSMAKKKRTHRIGRPFSHRIIIWRVNIPELVHGRLKFGGTLHKDSFKGFQYLSTTTYQQGVHEADPASRRASISPMLWYQH